MGAFPISRLAIIIRSARFVFITLVLMSPAMAIAGPAEEANTVVDQFSAAYSSNDPVAVVKLYTPDAILLGTVSPVISVGTEAIRKYFSMIKGSGNKNAIKGKAHHRARGQRRGGYRLLRIYPDAGRQARAGAIAFYHAYYQDQR